ncbi:hypothetical protein [Marinomonas spartinae]|uniref:Uncharacterized protein n=1 Tax=Marinomonas spartinae TaxID=1792290 RepID=A0A1A8TBD7_9GAMM|nr:hypothetical protein [Marinomonas spartinae]MBJ7555466.1 hypothetical protein [Marinomonas spartinae]SBS28900.1 hypothetical protein MSP8886_01353 [Marinomonas spartinae]
MNLPKELSTTVLNTRFNGEAAAIRHCLLKERDGKYASWDDEYEEDDGYGGDDYEGDDFDYEYEEDSMPDYEDGFFADTDDDLGYMEEQDDDFSMNNYYR